jgi:hypothetical protein
MPPPTAHTTHIQIPLRYFQAALQGARRQRLSRANSLLQLLAYEALSY